MSNTDHKMALVYLGPLETGLTSTSSAAGIGTRLRDALDQLADDDSATFSVSFEAEAVAPAVLDALSLRRIATVVRSDGSGNHPSVDLYEYSWSKALVDTWESQSLLRRFAKSIAALFHFGRYKRFLETSGKKNPRGRLQVLVAYLGMAAMLLSIIVVVVAAGTALVAGARQVFDSPSEVGSGATTTTTSTPTTIATTEPAATDSESTRGQPESLLWVVLVGCVGGLGWILWRWVRKILGWLDKRLRWVIGITLVLGIWVSALGIWAPAVGLWTPALGLWRWMLGTWPWILGLWSGASLLALVVFRNPFLSAVTAGGALLAAESYLRLADHRPSTIGPLYKEIDNLRRTSPYDRIDFMAYSFGSIVAMDAFFPHRGNEGITGVVEGGKLVTIGVPLDFVRAVNIDYFGPSSRISFASTPLAWHNIYSPVDLLGSNFREDDEGADATIQIAPDSGPNRVVAPTENVLFDTGVQITLVNALVLAGFSAHGTYWGADEDTDQNAITAVVSELYAASPLLA